jgi:formate-dependent nitrite reductase membrane component NrfD
VGAVAEPSGRAGTAERAPYGRRRAETLGALPTDAPPPTYYGLPAVKRSHYRWLVATYFFVGGLAGAAQLVAQVADLGGGRRDRPVVRWGRYLALLGALASPALLIRDLHTPSRWYNMLRIVRPTSPMSIGSWTLLGFGTCSGLTAVGQLLDDLGRGGGRALGRAFGLPAALLGMLMAVYTGVLLGATSTPLWAVAYRQLPALFGATAGASATAALSLVLACTGAPRAARRRLERLALVAGAAQLALALLAEREWRRRGVAGPLEARPVHRVVLGLGLAGPLVARVLQALAGGRSRRLAVLAAVATLVGAYAERAELIFAGNESAGRPEDYFRVARPEGRR